MQQHQPVGEAFRFIHVVGGQDQRHPALLDALIPDTEVEIIERCSGHDGTYAVKKEFHASAMKIVKPVVERVKKAEAAHYGSDCAMAGHHIENGMKDGREPEHPISLLRKAYGI